MKTYTFRANAAVIIVKNHQVLMFERADRPDEWQMPQGGIDVGETPLQAAYREMYEETGITQDDVRFIAEYPEWLSYEYPAELLPKGNHLGQVQRWFVFELLSDESAINLKTHHLQEFLSYKWTTADQLPDSVVAFKRPVYEKLAQFLPTLTY